MSIEAVKAYFRERNMEQRVTELTESSATVEMAAAAIGCTPGQIAKTLSFLVSGTPVLIICAGDRKIDNPKFKAQFHEKPKMIPAQEVEGYIGHGVGGVCPFAVRPGVQIYPDVSLRDHEAVYPAAGSDHSMVRLTCTELEDCIGSTWVDVCKIAE